ncbi:hypothetical protein LJ656_27385 [Paraburkholderia sp. MMS20-SJTR3]|uniref:ANTAR domain-containing protein n=1 Tax=Paraburkholderia sejongensis TaxID=2886946 RepID=A0ABS8K2I6_9BURK|nr:hypothetical protein [Paraburkholderia sp. MMS20-SJTR3]MCC8396318.1 hypothetical protein [Paraburkholderia sp. MMS20-SJTR3]
MRFHPKLIRVVDGEPHINTAGILLLSAEAVHGPTPPAADAIVRAQRTIDELLAAARAGGFAKAGILETMIAKERHSDRVVDMALEAMACIGGPSELAAVLARAGFDPEAS